MATYTVSDATTFFNALTAINESNFSTNIINITGNIDFASTPGFMSPINIYVPNSATSRSLTINGNGYALNVQNGQPLLFVKSGNVTINSVVFKGAKSQGQKGGISAGGGAGMGGAIFIYSGNVYINNSSFVGNQAIGGNGGGYGGEGSGGRMGHWPLYLARQNGYAQAPAGASGLTGNKGGYGISGSNGGNADNSYNSDGGYGGNGGSGGFGGNGGQGGIGGNGINGFNGKQIGGGGGDGGFGGGGGGGGRSGATSGGIGGIGGGSFFGGGGGGGGVNYANSLLSSGGPGGYGGGGGNNAPGGAFGGAGAPARQGGAYIALSGGGGGAGMGGAIFINNGTLNLQNVNFSNNTAQGGTGANPGQGLGGAIFAVKFSGAASPNLVNLSNVSFSNNRASDASGTVAPGTLSFGTAYDNADIFGNLFTGTVVAPGAIPTATQFKQSASKQNLGSVAYNLSPFSGNNITAQIQESSLQQTEAFFHNLFGLYEVVNLNGAILDSLDSNKNGRTDDLLNPGESGYALTALTNRVNNFVLQAGANGDASKNTTASGVGDFLVEGGKLYAPWAIANGGSLIPQGGTVQDGINAFLTQNPNNVGVTVDNFMTQAVAYFSFGAANPDGAEHLQNRGNGVFGFEDLPGNLSVSDFDFNDAVFQIKFLA